MTWMFGNWGPLPSTDPTLRRRVEAQLLHAPAQIILLAECDAEMEALLRRKGHAASAVAEADCPALDRRASYEFLTLRGKEDSSLCVAARANVCKQVNLKYWERRNDGHYKVKADGPTKLA